MCLPVQMALVVPTGSVATDVDANYGNEAGSIKDGILQPAADVRGIIDKTATYVARQGPARV